MFEHEFTIDKGHPCVDGHFPGMPLVPGAYLLCMLESALEAQFPGRTISAVKKVKFSRRFEPGAQAKIFFEEVARFHIVFRVVCEGQDIVSGKLQLSG